MFVDPIYRPTLESSLKQWLSVLDVETVCSRWLHMNSGGHSITALTSATVAGLMGKLLYEAATLIPLNGNKARAWFLCVQKRKLRTRVTRPQTTSDKDS